MGVVYKARQAGLNRFVALKRLHTARPEGLARICREAQAAARLDHPNIVQIYEVGEQDGRPFFSLEFCGGGSLEKKLNGTPLPPREAVEFRDWSESARANRYRARFLPVVRASSCFSGTGDRGGFRPGLVSDASTRFPAPQNRRAPVRMSRASVPSGVAGSDW